MILISEADKGTRKRGEKEGRKEGRMEVRKGGNDSPLMNIDAKCLNTCKKDITMIIIWTSSLICRDSLTHINQ